MMADCFCGLKLKKGTRLWHIPLNSQLDRKASSLFLAEYVEKIYLTWWVDLIYCACVIATF